MLRTRSSQQPQQVSRADQLQWFSNQQRLRQLPKPVDKAITKGRRRLTRSLSDEFRRALVALYFGSRSDFSHPVIGTTKLGKLLHISPNTITSVLHSFRRHGGELATFRKKQRPKPRLVRLEGIRTALLSRAVLTRWAGLTLQQRASEVQRRYGIKCSKNGLREFYLLNGVRFRNVQMVYRTTLTNRIALTRHRRQFAETLGSHII